MERHTDLLSRIRDSIDQAASALPDARDQRAITRVLAHLWSAHDELELLSRGPRLVEGAR
jgi:hypothetical protein